MTFPLHFVLLQIWWGFSPIKEGLCEKQIGRKELETGREGRGNPEGVGGLDV